MTHFQPTIKALRDFNTRSVKVKKAKKIVISALYSEERKEDKPRKTRKQSPKRKGSFIGFVGKSVSKSISSYQERQREKRIEKANKVKAIRESNLPQEKKQQEQAKLNVPVYKEESKPIVKEKPKPFGGFKSAETETTSEGV